jgi:hypothetical protein
MKKRLVLTLMASALLVLAGCGGQTSSSPAVSSAPTTSTPASTSTSTSASSTETVYTAVTISNKAVLEGAWHVGDSNLQIEIATTPEGNVTKLLNEGKLTITSSDTAVVSVIGVYLTAVAPGTVTITVKMGTLTDTANVTVLAADKDYAAVALADGMKDGAVNGAHTYISQVKVESFKTGSDGGTYGNFNVTDADGNNKTIVYGASASLSALAFNATTKIWKFTNPKDFMSNDATKAIKVGDTLDIVYIRCDYSGTKEISAVILGINGVAIANCGTAAAPLTSDEIAAVTDQQKLYTYYVSGKISAWTGSNTDGSDYGNFMLKSDGATGDAITVYGASAAGKLAYNFAKNATVFTNAKDWKTNTATKDLKIGDTVTLQVIRSDYNTTKEIMGIVIPTQAKVDPVIADKAIKDVAAYTAADNTVIHVSGIWAENHGTLKYGNGYLMDPATGDVVLVYGCSKTATGLVKTDTGTGSYTGVWTNPQDFAADTLTLGSYVTIEGIVDYFSSSKTVELEGVITTEVKPTDAAYTYKYAASATAVAATDGTVTLSKTSELAFGEAVTITPTPASGKKIDTVVVDHGYGKETIIADASGVYSFKANVMNVVTVAFKDDVLDTTLTLSPTTLSNHPSSYGDGLSTIAVNGTDVGIQEKQTTGGSSKIQMNNKPSYIYNTVAIPGAITDITIAWNSSTTSTNKNMAIVMGKTADSVSTAATAGVFGKESTAFSYEASSAYTFFQICHVAAVSGAMYIDSIVITFVPQA